VYTGDVQVSFYLSVESVTFTPEEISRRIGSFDRCHRIGDPRGKTGKVWDKNEWEIVQQASGPFRVTGDVFGSTLNILLSRLDGREEAFAELAKAGDAVLRVVITSDGYPGISLTPNQLTRLQRLGMSVDFDLYCDPKTSE
jgi:hypothetical protein